MDSNALLSTNLIHEDEAGIIFLMPLPEITTERLLLRPLRLSDAPDMYAYAQDELVARPGMWEPYESFEACQRHVEHLIARYEIDLMWWALEHLADGRMIGRVQLSEWNEEHSRAELSYALHRDYWGRGLMSEAVAEAVAYGWNELDLHRIGATVLPDNVASIRILKGVGMQHEGRLRHFRRLWGEWVDVDVYAVVADS